MRRKVLESWMIDVTERAILEGMPLKLIGGLIGVHATKLNVWYREGLEDDCKDELKVRFAERVDYARSKSAQEGIALMKGHAIGDYRAALELLKVSDPETWNTSRKVEVQSDVVVTTKRDLSSLSHDELLLLQRLEEKARLGSGD